MKLKLLSLILVIATLLTLVACGNESANENSEEKNASAENSVEESVGSNTATIEDENTDPDENTPDENTPDENVFPFAGEWVPIMKTEDSAMTWIPVSEDDEIENVVISNDGAIVSGDKKYSASTTDFELNKQDTVKINFSNYKTYRFAPQEDGTYLMYDKYTYFFKKEDYADYDIIDLTTENVSEYIELEWNIECSGFLSGNDNSKLTTGHKFKDGLGAASFAYGNFIYSETTKSVAFTRDPEVYTIGDVVASGTSTVFNDITVFAPDSENIIKTYDWLDKNGEGVTENIVFYDIIGAEKIIGKAFVPKSRNK